MDCDFCGEKIPDLWLIEDHHAWKVWFLCRYCAYGLHLNWHSMTQDA